MCSCLFIMRDVLSLWEEQRKKIEREENRQIMIKKLYGTYSGGTIQMCSVQFLEHDLHIFAYNISNM